MWNEVAGIIVLVLAWGGFSAYEAMKKDQEERRDDNKNLKEWWANVVSESLFWLLIIPAMYLARMARTALLEDTFDPESWLYKLSIWPIFIAILAGGYQLYKAFTRLTDKGEDANA